MKSPPQLSREAIEEFKKIYSEEFGKTLSEDDAQQMAVDILRLFDALIIGSERSDSHEQIASAVERHSSVR